MDSWVKFKVIPRIFRRAVQARGKRLRGSNRRRPALQVRRRGGAPTTTTPGGGILGKLHRLLITGPAETRSGRSSARDDDAARRRESPAETRSGRFSARGKTTTPLLPQTREERGSLAAAAAAAAVPSSWRSALQRETTLSLSFWTGLSDWNLTSASTTTAGAKTTTPRPTNTPACPPVRRLVVRRAVHRRRSRGGRASAREGERQVEERGRRAGVDGRAHNLPVAMAARVLRSKCPSIDWNLANLEAVVEWSRAFEGNTPIGA